MWHCVYAIVSNTFFTHRYINFDENEHILSRNEVALLANAHASPTPLMKKILYEPLLYPIINSLSTVEMGIYFFALKI